MKVDPLKIVSVIGAGDSFHAGLIAGLVKTYYKSEEERFRFSIKLGLDCAALSIQSYENVSPLIAKLKVQ